MGKEHEDNYVNKMTIIKEKEFENLNNDRFNLETHLEDQLIKKKVDEIAHLV